MKEHEYPKNINNYKQVDGYGGVRLYRVPGDETAASVEKLDVVLEPLPTETTPLNGLKLERFYINVNHGERHVMLVTDSESACARATALVPEKYKPYEFADSGKPLEA